MDKNNGPKSMDRKPWAKNHGQKTMDNKPWEENMGRKPCRKRIKRCQNIFRRNPSPKSENDR